MDDDDEEKKVFLEVGNYLHFIIITFLFILSVRLYAIEITICLYICGVDCNEKFEMIIYALK